MDGWLSFDQCDCCYSLIRLHRPSNQPPYVLRVYAPPPSPTPQTHAKWRQFSNVLGDEDGNGGIGDLGESGAGDDFAAEDAAANVVDFLGQGAAGFEQQYQQAEGDEQEEEDAEDGDEDDDEEEEEVELTVDEDGRIVFDGGEMDYAVRCVAAIDP
jgi:hypothetical protein